MSRLKQSVNPPYSDIWISRVGKLILNFSVLEFESNLWLVQFSEDPGRIEEFAKMRFASRVKETTLFIENRAFSDVWKAEALICWNQALDLAKFRNRIAHNPLTFGWNKKEEEGKGEPDFIGIIDMKRLDPNQNTLVSKSDMDDAVDSAVALANQLEKLRIEWCTIRDNNDESTGAS